MKVPLERVEDGRENRASKGDIVEIVATTPLYEIDL